MSEAYRIVERAPLRARNTFGIDATARCLVEVDDASALPHALADPRVRGGPVLVLGGGSNLLFAGDPGLVLSLDARATTVLDDDGAHARVRADAGVAWHGFVMDMVARGYGGIENLALIPGTVGAAPIQNIGAYGVEVCDAIHAVEAWEPATGVLHRLTRAQCAFAYRDSLFKRDPARWIVTAVEFALARDARPALGYAGIDDELAAMGVSAPRTADVAQAVIRLRRRKLPDPAAIGNAGSFFKNPVVGTAFADALRDAHPGLPVFPAARFPADALAHGEQGSDSLRKLSAAWLIEQCGWKGHRDGDAGVSDRHALVLVNHGRATGLQLLDLARRIAASVQARFGVAIEPEPRVVGAAW